MRHFWTLIEFTLKNFATPIAFFWMFRAYGAKPAIAMAIVVTGIQLFAHWALQLTLSPFFLVASGFTVGLGSIDLVVASPRFFRLEPFAQNFVMGLVFLTTVFTSMPIVAWFAAALPEKVRPRIDESSRAYLRNVTIAWSAYFFVKSFVFLWLAFQVDLGQLVILRTIIGGGSLAVMFLGEIAYRKLVRKM